jgi:hypothetical protein
LDVRAFICGATVDVLQCGVVPLMALQRACFIEREMAVYCVP